MFNHIKISLRLLIALTALTGVFFPAFITGTAQLIFPDKANGSLILIDGQPVGSAFIGQAYANPAYFWGRPSMTDPTPYNAAASSGSNLGPTNPAFLELVEARITALQEADPDNNSPIPIDLVTASASGLDPHISPAAAAYQVSRVARTRGLSENVVEELVAAHIEVRWLGILGEPRVNVLALNLALDTITGAP